VIWQRIQSPPRIGKEDCRSQFSLGEIGEWERNEYYCARCKCDQALSSSDLFQSFARACSLRRTDS
jgi:hypothetical protein